MAVNGSGFAGEGGIQVSKWVRLESDAVGSVGYCNEPELDLEPNLSLAVGAGDEDGVGILCASHLLKKITQ